MANINRLTILIVGGFLFIVDRIFKTLSISIWPGEHLAGRFIGWSPSVNTGIAFGLPVPAPAVITLSVIFIICLAVFFWRTKNIYFRYGIFFLLLGAFSNLFDRLYYGETVDYFFFFITLFNLADILIIAGAAICLTASTAKAVNK